MNSPREESEEHPLDPLRSLLDLRDLQQDLQQLEDKWFKQASRLTSHLLSPLHDAAAKGNVPAMARMVLTDGQDVNSRDAVQSTPLHWSSGSGYARAVAWLLDHGADINAVNKLGDTALHKAAWRCHQETVELLCARGADCSVVNRHGSTALDLARDAETAAIIRNHSRQGGEDLSNERASAL
ncbi:osteoclast-stimulating factor 1-like [Schistocerca gregaria]|uniref:osteoclast-stimulating factor 1-like n=1 Tax=Schistocerca gregaria TaxID=7010 RepID=UPI00211DD828|nr:osteoclast-stimulating factor 1-like [Schistocerca gregaria]